MKQQFIEIYNDNIKRPGADKLLAWLETTDFFEAPASTRYHLNRAQGLIEHSIHVYERLREIYIHEKDRDHRSQITLTDQEEEKIAICGLFHDLCKAQFYKKAMKNVKNEQTGKWEKQPYYQIEDQFPYGHGEKSVYLLERFIRLKPDEAVAIRWHMGGFDDSVKGGSMALSNAFEKYQLAVMLHIADMQATYFDEKEDN